MIWLFFKFREKGGQLAPLRTSLAVQKAVASEFVAADFDMTILAYGRTNMPPPSLNSTRWPNALKSGPEFIRKTRTSLAMAWPRIIPRPWHDIVKQRNGVSAIQNEKGVTEDYVESFGWYNLQTPGKGKTNCRIIRKSLVRLQRPRNSAVNSKHAMTRSARQLK